MGALLTASGRRRARIVATLGTVGALLVLPAMAHAYPQGRFACYATALHVDGASEPLVANVNAVPCFPDAHSAASNQVSGSAGSAQSGQNSAATSNTQDYNPTDNYTPVNGDQGTARATALEAVIVSGSTVIKADVFDTQATVTCTNGNPVMTGSASVGDLTVNGKSVPVTGGPQTISTPAGTLYVDTAYEPGTNVLYQRGLWLQTSAGDIIVSEAAVGFVNSPCLNGSPPPPPSPPTPAFGCRGIALEDDSSLNFVANPSVLPCSSGKQAGAAVTLDNSFISVSGPYAQTTSNPDPLPAYSALTPYPNGTYVTASAGASHVDLAPGTGQEITAGPTSAVAAGSCQLRTVSLTSDSDVHGLTVGGARIADGEMPVEIPLGGGEMLHVNWFISDGYFIERRALWLQAPQQGLDVMVGDAIAGANDANPC